MKVVQIWYKRKARPAKPLSLRLYETTKSSIPVAGSKTLENHISMRFSFLLPSCTIEECAYILILWSFPSVKSREEVFFYGHKQNRFWKVIQSSRKCGLEYGKASECMEDYKKVLTLPLGQPLPLSNHRMKYVRISCIT